MCSAAKSCPTLCDPVACSPPGPSVHGIPQARVLEWVAMPSSRESSQPRDRTRVSYVSCIGRWVLYHQHHLGKVKLLIRVRLFGTPWTVAYKLPQSSCTYIYCTWAFQMALVVKLANARNIRDVDSNPRLGRFPGGGHGNPLQYSCLENPMDRGAWKATVHGVTKCQTGLSN